MFTLLLLTLLKIHLSRTEAPLRAENRMTHVLFYCWIHTRTQEPNVYFLRSTFYTITEDVEDHRRRSEWDSIIRDAAAHGITLRVIHRRICLALSTRHGVNEHLHYLLNWSLHVVSLVPSLLTMQDESMTRAGELTLAVFKACRRQLCSGDPEDPETEFEHDRNKGESDIVGLGLELCQ